MKFESVMSLREEINMMLLPRLDALPDQGEDESYLTHAIGLGVASHRKGDYRLAVRTQSHDDELRPLVEAITRRARGEVDLRYVDIVRAESRARPIVPGASINAPGTGAGTLGLFVRDRVDGATLLMTCMHVVAASAGSAVGAPVLQPAELDGGESARDVVATVRRHGHLTGRAPMDCAIAHVHREVECQHSPMSGWCDGRFAPVDPTLIGVPVRKLGRTTHESAGVVSGIEVEISVRFDSAIVRFANLVEVSTAVGAFSARGDSGSLVVETATGRAVGLHTAGSRHASYSQAIGPLLDHFSVDLLV